MKRLMIDEVNIAGSETLNTFSQLTPSQPPSVNCQYSPDSKSKRYRARERNVRGSIG